MVMRVRTAPAVRMTADRVEAVPAAMQDQPEAKLHPDQLLPTIHQLKALLRHQIAAAAVDQVEVLVVAAAVAADQPEAAGNHPSKLA